MLNTTVEHESFDELAKRSELMISVNPSTSNLEKLDLHNLPAEQTALDIKNLNLYYGQDQALHDISMRIPNNRVTAFIGPSGCGKSTPCAGAAARALMRLGRAMASPPPSVWRAR